jgi:hypothetical protein
MGIPFLAIGNDELKDRPTVKKGDLFDCPHCAEKHPLECGADEHGNESDLALFYKCGDKSYLAALYGKLLPICVKGEKN